MKGAIEFIKNREWLAIVLATIVGVLAVTGAVTAATTISTSIVTGGDVTVTGSVYATSTVQAGGALIGYSTMSITGDAALAHASTTQITNSGTAWFGGNVNMNGASSVLTLTTANDATSTATVGCIQTYATSTATPVKLIMGSPNVTATTTFTSTTGRGFVVWAFGSCPSI